MTVQHSFKGIHHIIDCFGCNNTKIDDQIFMRDLLINLCNKYSLCVLNFFVYKFHPCGLTTGVIISESHITVHTWPEDSYASLDVYTCSNYNQNNKHDTIQKTYEICKEIITSLEASSYKMTSIERGTHELLRKVE